MGLTITAHRKFAGGVSYHSRRRISCAASQREAEHGVSWLEAVRWAPPSPLHLRNFSHASYKPVHDSPNKTSQISANNQQAKSAEVADQVLAQRPRAGQGLHAVHTRAGTYSKIALL
jgi:hypothetical protein